MEFDNAFDVPLPPAQAWAVLMDVRRVAPCMPGAELTEIVDDRTFKGKVSVRLGPVALTFAGTAQFEEIDAAAHTAKIKASGTDAKGRGGAQSVVSFGLEPAGSGSKVLVHTNLNLSGAVAQYGRGAGMIQDVANQLIKQFAASLKTEIARSEPAAGAAESSAGAAIAPPASPAPAAKPISGFALLLRSLWAGLLRRLSGQSRA
ncbi:MAG TPA: SRPBCC family protein [Alphaproteobacteria bacterium]